jgi:hypothetical protein
MLFSLILLGQVLCSPVSRFKITSKVSDDNFAHQSPFPPLNLSGRCSNLSRALSPDHANKWGWILIGGSFWASSGPRHKSATDGYNRREGP